MQLSSLAGTNQQSARLPWCLLRAADNWSPHQCLCPCSSLAMQSSKLLDHHLKGGNACSSVINMHLFTWGARTALLPCSRTVIYPASQPAGRPVGRQWRKVLTTGSRASYRSRAAAARSCSPSSPVSSSATRSRSACGIFRGARRHICHRLVWRSPPLPLSPKPPWLKTTGSGRGCTLPWFFFFDEKWTGDI